jgi:anaerobic selenocysteine-containing dehydrogenase
MRTLKIAWTSTDEQGFKYLQELKKSNKKIICIDPEKNETCTYLNAKWIPIIPGTDVALMLGMAYHLLQTNNYDKKFLDEYTEGFDKFRDYILGKEDNIAKDTKWASKISGIDEQTIKELALLMYENRTMIMAGVENIVFCCNRSTADHIISSPLFLDPTYERTVPDYSNYAKRFENKPVVAEAVESAKKRKKRKIKK